MHRDLFIPIALIFIVSIGILYLPILFVLKKKVKGIIRQLSYLGLFSSIFLIIFATILFVPIINTFTPFRFNLGTNLNFIPFGWLRQSSYIDKQLLQNIIMFIPLGFFIPVVFDEMRKLYRTTLIVFLVTFSIEILQYLIGRPSDIDDIIMNLLGSIIGYIMFKIFNILFESKKWWNKLIEKI